MEHFQWVRAHLTWTVSCCVSPEFMQCEKMTIDRYYINTKGKALMGSEPRISYLKHIHFNQLWEGGILTTVLTRRLCQHRWQKLKVLRKDHVIWSWFQSFIHITSSHWGFQWPLFFPYFITVLATWAVPNDISAYPLSSLLVPYEI